MLSLRTGGVTYGAGGRASARRLVVTAVVLLAASLKPLATAEGPLEPQVTVQEQQGVYRVQATFTVMQPASVATAVLTDYERIPSFMPDVRTSRVLERSLDRTVIEQEAIARFLLFSRRIHLLLEVQQEPGTIRFRDLCGQSFTRYEGTWTLTEKNGRTSIGYSLDATPSFDVPEFLLKRLLRRDAAQMIEKLQAEIGARAR